MTKLLKNSKSAFAFLIAFAIIAVSLFTGVAINADACDVVKNDLSNVMWNAYEPDSKFITNAVAGVGDTEANPYIIESAGQLRYLAQSFIADYVGKYFKIADGVDIICLQSSDNLKANLGKSTDKEALGAFMALSSYTEVKNYFETHSAKRNQWQSGANRLPFDAHIDFNGATVVGMYNGDGGLFSRVGPNASFKNLKITNSYVTSGDGSGALFGTVYDYNNGTAEVVSGTVKVDNVEITNTYVSTSTTNKRAGVLFGYTRFKDTLTVSINNVLIHGCTSVIAGTAYNSLYGLSGGNLSAGNESKYPGCNWQFENSILLGITPWRADLNNCFQPDNPDNFKNVYTDITELNSGFTNRYENASYTGKITTIDESKLSEFTSTESCPNLDWANTWMLTEKGPQLRLFHNFESKQTETTHSFECTDCGLKQYGGDEDHSWSNGACQNCGYVCQHKSQTVETNEGDCVTQTTVKMHCNACGKEEVSKVGLAPSGHDLEWVENGTDTCGSSTVNGYWYCKTCDKYFSGSDKASVTFAKMKAAVSGPAKHKIVKVDEIAATDKMEGTKAHYECEVCHEMYLDAEGKTKALQADLVIAKATPSGFAALLGGKSPATGESIAVAVASVAALVCASFVILRKVRKFN